MITPLEIVDRPTDPYRIIGILEELRRVWSIEPRKTLGEFLAEVCHKEYKNRPIYEITDDELLAAIQNYNT